MNDLRTAAQQALEFVTSERWGTTPYMDVCVYEDAARLREALRAALAQQDEPLINQCGETCERAKLCAVCASKLAEPVEPVQEPFGYLWPTGRHPEFRFTQQKRDGVDGMPLYTAPPQRPPLTDKEILLAVGWERAEMYMKLAPNFPVDEAKQETLKNARAIERKVRGEKT